MNPRLVQSTALALGLWCAPLTMAGTDFDVDDGTVTVENWLYRLQGENGDALKPKPLAQAPHDLVVMEFSRYGDEGSKFSPTQIDRIKHSHVGWGGTGDRKVVLAYLSIGEASEFRSYWDPAWTEDGSASSDLTNAAPNWLGPVNPDWTESRKVKYWKNGWKKRIFNDDGDGWLDQILDQGFDGAYLDIVDAYEFWAEENDGLTELEAAQRMIDFVLEIAAHARTTNPDFIIFPQNASLIVDVVRTDDPTRYAAYLAAIDGIGIEDVYFYGDKNKNNAYNPQTAELDVLRDDYRDNGIPVFVTEYLTRTNKIATFYGAALSDCFHAYVSSSRDLDDVGAFGPNPDCGGADADADFDDDGDVDEMDLLILTMRWGLCAAPCPPSCVGDLDGDCDVDVDDVNLLMVEWTG